jgi:hypothetical protein
MIRNIAVTGNRTSCAECRAWFAGAERLRRAELLGTADGGVRLGHESGAWNLAVGIGLLTGFVGATPTAVTRPERPAA